MPFVGEETAVGANAEVDLLAGTQYEFSGPNGNLYNIACVNYNPTLANASLVLDVKFGSFEVTRGMSMRKTATLGDGPDVSKDMRVSQRSPRGVKVQIIARNTTADANNTIIPLIEIK